MKKTVLVLLGLFLLNSILFAAEPPKTKLRLKAKSIIYDRSSGDIMLDGDVLVTRTTEGEELTVNCQQMRARINEDKLDSVQATGDVTMHTAQYDAASARASFDFAQNIIVLYGDPAVPARVESKGIVSTGPKIIYHMDKERVELPDGGDTIIDLKGMEKKDRNGKDGEEQKEPATAEKS